MEYRVLGPLEVRDGERSLPLAGAKQRALLAQLLLNANRVVSRERLIDELWGEEPPETAVTSVQVYVSRLRKLFPPGTLVTRPPGYLLAVDAEKIDLFRFERLLAQAREAGLERRSLLLREALTLWRGPPLAEFSEPFAQVEGGRLEDLRIAAIEERIAAELALGRHAELIGELETLIAENPHRERLRGQLMLALYRSGRQAEALEEYRKARATLDELGIEPSDELRKLEKAILTQDATLAAPAQLVSGAVELPGPLRMRSPFPFVGREKDLDTLRSLLTIAEQGEGGQVALVSGEAGSGKTRLARELAREAIEHGTLVLYGASHADVNVPYQPFVDALGFLVRVCDPEAVTSCLGTGGGELTRLLPDMAARLGPFPEPLKGDPDTERHRLHAAVADFVTSVSRLQPLLVVLDDMHWADAPALRLLRHLSRTTPEARMLLLATHRDRTEDVRPEFSDALADLSRIDGVTHVGLRALSDDNVAEFIRRSAGTESELSTLAIAICRLTDGAPFLLCELWRALIDTGTVEIVDGAVRLTRPLAELGSPESVRNVVHYRLSRLAPSTSAMLEVAAVVGSEFELTVLGEPATLEESIDEALRSGMIEEVPGLRLVHRFAHELVRRALYDRLPRVRRAKLHLRVGEALERAHAADPVPVLPDLAHHFALAASLGGTHRAFEYNVRAAKAAIESLGFEEASARLMTAIEFGMDKEVAHVTCGLAFVLMDIGCLAEADSLLAKAIDAADSLGDSSIQACLAVVRGHVLLRTDPDAVEEMRAVADAAIRTLAETDDHLGLAHAWRLLSLTDTFGGRWGNVEDALRRALVHARHAGDRREQTTIVSWLLAALYNGPTPAAEAIRQCESVRAEFAGDPLVEARTACHLAALLAMTGRFDEARDLGREGTTTLDELGLRTTSGHARVIVAEVEMLAGDLGAAEQQLVAAHAVLEEVGERAGADAATFEIARALCAQGRFAEADRWMALGRDLLERSDQMVRSVGLSVEARLSASAGRLVEAEELARRAANIVEGTDALNIRAASLVTLSKILALAGRELEARESRDDAVCLYEAKGNKVAAAQARAKAASSAAPA